LLACVLLSENFIHGSLSDVQAASPEELMPSEKIYRTRRGLECVLLLCAFAVGLSASVEASHLHLGKSPESLKNCSLCLSAHSSTATNTATVQQAAPVLRSSTLVLPRETAPVSRLEAASLYIRPPPTV